MNQPGMVIVSQDERPLTTNVAYIQPPTVISAEFRVTKSCPLIGFGIVLCILSSISIGLSTWIMDLSKYEAFAIVSVACSFVFFLLSVFAMYGGNDVGRRQYSIIWAMVLGILGIVVSLVAILLNIAALTEYLRKCADCEDPGFAREVDHTVNKLVGIDRCGDECFILSDKIAYGPVHVVLVLAAALEGLVALILSISACCTACSCCACYGDYHPPGGVILQSPIGPNHYTITQSPQIPYQPLGTSYAC